MLFSGWRFFKRNADLKIFVSFIFVLNMDVYQKSNNFASINRFLKSKGISNNKCYVNLNLDVINDINGRRDSYNGIEVIFNRSNNNSYEVEIENLSPYTNFSTNYQFFEIVDDQLIIKGENYQVTIS